MTVSPSGDVTSREVINDCSGFANRTEGTPFPTATNIFRAVCRVPKKPAAAAVRRAVKAPHRNNLCIHVAKAEKNCYSVEQLLCII